MKKALLICALITGTCFGQGVRYDSNNTTSAKNVPPGAQAPVMTLPYSTVTVCGYPATGNPCTNTVPIYSDEALTQVITQPLQSDSQGRFGFWIAPALYSYSVTTAGGTNVGTFPLSLNSPPGPQGPGGIGCGAANCIVSAPSTAQTITQGSGTSLNVNVINNVEDASQFAGSDIGAKINAAFAACPVTQSCKVTLPPGHNYSYSTMFTIPGTLQYTALDCQGSALTFTGSGDASQVAQRNDADPTGDMSNCRIINGSGNTASLAAVHQFSRIWFTYNNNTFYGFNNAGGVGLELENNAGTGWPGYNERTHFNGNSFSLDTKGVEFKATTGTSSYARQVMIGTECNIVDGQICVSVEGTGGFQSGDVYGSYIEVHANSSGDTVRPRVISLTNGGAIRLGLANIEGEGAGAIGGYLFYIADSTSLYQMSGSVSNQNLANFNGATSDAIATSPTGNRFTVQGIPFENGTEQSTNDKFIFDGSNLRLGLPVDFATPHGTWQIYQRTTTNPSDPEVDATPSTGNVQKNIAYCVATGPGTGGCGFGAGYGNSPTTGGTNTPAHDLEFNGTFGNQAGTFGVDANGVQKVKQIKTGTPSNTNLAGVVTLSGGTGTYTFSPAFANSGFCVASDTTNANPVKVNITTTTLTLFGTGSDVIYYICITGQ